MSTDAIAGFWFLMMIVGVFGAGALAEMKSKRWRRIAITAWMLVWIGPPLGWIWVKGVMG